MEWKGEELLTIGDLMNKGIDRCDTPEEAQEFMRIYRAENEHADSNIGYVSCYYPPDRAVEIRSWFNVEHPIFGTGNPSIDQALKAGCRAATTSKRIPELVREAHQNAVNKGWYEEPATFGEQIANVHSEVSEAWEDYRNGHGFREIYYEIEDSKPKPRGIPIELADTVIRIFDTCGHLGIDLEAAIREKMAYNATRPIRHGGKKL